MNQITNNIYPNVAKMAMSQISDYAGQGKCSHVVISNGKIVQACSSNYGLLKNEDFFGAFEAKMREEHIQFKAIYRNRQDAQFAADYILDGELSVATKADTIQPKIRLINSYDGSSFTSGSVGFYRQICSNGLHALKYEIDFKVRHTEAGVVAAIPSIHDMIERYSKTEGVNLVRRFEVLAEAAMSHRDAREIVKSVVSKTNLFKFEKSDKNPDPSLNAQFVLDVISRETRTLKTVPNKWIVYNALNEWLNNDSRNQKTDAIRTATDAKIFEAVEAF